MERGSITKWLLLALAAVLFFTVGMPMLTGSGSSHRNPFEGINDMTPPPAAERDPNPATCTIDGDRFQAEFSSQGASLQHLRLTDARYKLLHDDEVQWRNRKAGEPLDLVTTTLQARMPLRTDLRKLDNADAQQIPYHELDWKLAASDGKSCSFTYQSDTTSLTKTIAATGKPFELEVSLKVENLADGPRKHRLAIEQTSHRTKKESEGGGFGRQSEFLTETTAVTTQKVERQTPGDFEADDFEKDESRPPNEKEFTAEKWRQFPGDARFVAISSSYFSKILIPLEGPVTMDAPGAGSAPRAETQIEELWDAARYPDKEKDPNVGHIYRARLAYPEVELPPKGSATYKVLSFTGPKERDVLAALGHHTDEVLDLGTFAPIAKALIWYLYKLYDLVGVWGWAIVLLTITVRTLLFPLSISQIKSSMAMRRLKPEMDAINEKYKDDATQRGLAIQELWRKNNVTNPVLGCLPMLLQMPVWWALYRSLQTAVELYHTQFAWFADLSAPDRFYIIPVVLGASSFIQQKLMPAQGDPQQQKMMLYMMPAVFTFMMLFLPAGLGVYMLTNTWLGIVQQLLVERYLKSRSAPSASIEVREVREKTMGDGGKPTPALGKGKARARG
jgi:YidC/Oxa1 family membrane protein insertase